MNFLITSAGKCVPLIRYLKENFGKGNKIIVCTHDCLSPALYAGNSGYIVPPFTNNNYISILKQICHKENAKAILSVHDNELSILASHKKDFEALGISVIVSNLNAVNICLDKYKTFLFLKRHNFLCAKTYKDFNEFKTALNAGEISFPVFVKPRNGAGSNGAQSITKYSELKYAFQNEPELIVQEYLTGQEYGIDAYVDLLSHEVISIFIRKKFRMFAGQTDKAVSIIDNMLSQTIENLLKALHVIGPIDIDVIKTNNGYYICDINPRFGGSYALAHECGENYPLYLRNNLEGKINTPNIGNYKENIYMMKYTSVIIKKKEELYPPYSQPDK